MTVGPSLYDWIVYIQKDRGGELRKAYLLMGATLRQGVFQSDAFVDYTGQAQTSGRLLANLSFLAVQYTINEAAVEAANCNQSFECGEAAQDRTSRCSAMLANENQDVFAK